MAIESINPATEEVMATYEELTRDQIGTALDAAVVAFADWQRRPLAERGELMARAGAYLRQHKDRFARLITIEMGKPITQAQAEIEPAPVPRALTYALLYHACGFVPVTLLGSTSASSRADPSERSPGS